MKKNKTSWSKAAGWYSELLNNGETYQKKLILPNLLRLLDIQKKEVILDLGCGPGFFTNEFLKNGAKIIGADISKELIQIARSNMPESRKQDAFYFVSPADSLKVLKDESTDKVTIILAIQNMENMQGVFSESGRVLKPKGKLFLVLNHPAFRIPKESGWEWDAKNKIQYRRIESYLSESKAKIQTHPSTSSGRVPGEYTLSFHRPLQSYFKALEKSGFFVQRMEEWNSNRKSKPGPRAAAENRARKEIPLFLFLEAVKN